MPFPQRPLPRAATLLALLPLLLGCGSALGTATAAANVAHDVLEVGRVAIDEACVPAYREAQSPAQLAAVDESCLPASTAYKALRVAWLAAVAAILAGGEPVRLTAVLDRLARASADLALAAGALR